MGALTLIKLSYFSIGTCVTGTCRGRCWCEGVGGQVGLDSGVEREEERTSSPRWGEVGTD